MKIMTNILPLSAAVLMALGTATVRADDQTDVTMTVVDESADPQAVYHQIELPLQQAEQIRIQNQTQTQTQSQVRTQTRSAYDDEPTDKAEVVRERAQETVREQVRERIQERGLDAIPANAAEHIQAQGSMGNGQ